LYNSFETLKRDNEQLFQSKVELDEIRVKLLAFIDKLTKHFNLTLLSTSDKSTYDMSLFHIYNKIEKLLEYENNSEEMAKLVKENKKLEINFKKMKDELASKDIHLDQMHRKLVHYEESEIIKSDLTRQVEKNLLCCRQSKVKIDRLNEEIRDLKKENVQLRAQLLETTTLKVSAFILIVLMTFILIQ
jgi:hypothetical protein